MSPAVRRKSIRAPSLDERFIECRAGGHAWRYVTAFAGWDSPSSARWAVAHYVLHKRCDVCGTWKHIAVGAKGERLAYSYEYAEGYVRPAGQGSLDRDQLRLWEAKKYGQRLRRIK